MKISFLIIFHFLVGSVIAQNKIIKISGSVDHKPNTLVEIQVYDDYLSPVTHTVGFCKTDENKKFYIDFKAEQINKYRLLIGDKAEYFYLTPGNDYRITIDNKFEDISIESDDPINDQVSVISKAIWDLRVRRKYKSIKDIKILEDSLESYVLAHNVSNYVKSYYKYSMGVVYSDYSVITLADTSAAIKLVKELLFDSPVLFKNSKYLTFIDHHYLYNFISLGFKYSKPGDEDDPFEVYLNQLRSIPNDTVQQIAILSASKNAYTSQWGYDQKRISSVVDSIKSAAVHKSIGLMANYFKNKYGSSRIGQLVVDFTLYKSKNESVQLHDYFGKYLLLDFWFTGCSPCIEAMPLKKKLYNKYANKLEILSIDPVDKFERLEKWIGKNSKYNWVFLSAYQNRKLKDFFQITGYPTYILIDPEGEIIFAPKEFRFKEIYKQIEEQIK